MISKELVILGNGRTGNYAQIGSLAGAHQYRLLYRLVKKFIPPKSSVLDWGAGNGHFSYFLCRKNYRATGFSMEDFSFKNWLKNYDYKFVKGKTNKPSKLPFKNQSFDCVVSVGVLEHVREFGGDELKSLKEIFRILKNEGFFVCYHLPNYYSLNEIIGKLFTKKFHHAYRFTESDIEKLAKKSGLKKIEVGRYGFLPRNSLAKLPSPFRLSKSFAVFWDILDNILTLVFSPFCQNYFFVARKVI